jgi:hypothetical protein
MRRVFSRLALWAAIVLYLAWDLYGAWVFIRKD